MNAEIRTIAFRVDASLGIGTGHVMRCLTLAKALRDMGATVFFISRDLPGNMIEQMEERGFCVVRLPAPEGPLPDHPPTHAAWAGVHWEQDAAETHIALEETEVDWLIVDHYAFDERWEKAVHRDEIGIMVIDDLADRRHYCKILLDQNFGRSRRDYSHLVPSYCNLLLGSRYVLLRSEFSTMRQQSLQRRRPGFFRHILVSMGGGDRSNITGSVLDALAESVLPKETTITVVVYPTFKSLAQIQLTADKMHQKVSIRTDVQDMAALMSDCDLAIGSGGGTTYERMFLGLPAFVQPLADNQRAHLQVMEEAGLFKLFTTPDELRGLVATELRRGLSTNPSLVANGTNMIAHELLCKKVILRSPQPLDLRRTFQWLLEPELRKLFLMRIPPTRSVHFQYWRKILRDENHHVFSIICSDTHCGNAGIKNICLKQGVGELWLYIGDVTKRGAGLGHRTLVQLEDFMNSGLGLSRAMLHVSRNNTAAVSLYLSNGYKEVKMSSRDLLTFYDDSVVRMEKVL